MNEHTVATWFDLRQPNFILDPRTDAGFFAPRTRINIHTIIEGLEVDLVTNLPPKRLFWGIYGGGKTHTLFHIAKELEGMMPVYAVYVECPSVPKRSTFLHLYHEGIMTGFGRDYICELFQNLLESVGLMQHDKLRAKLAEELADEDLGRAVAALLGFTEEKRLAFWRYISGVTVPPRDLDGLGQTQDLTDAEPARLASIIITIGKVVKKLRKQTVVLVLDELDRLKAVTDEFAGSTFQTAFQKLMDQNQKDVAVLMSSSADGLRELPDVFGGERGPVLSRIGHGLVEIPEIDAVREIDDFIKAIIKHVRRDDVDFKEKVAKLNLSKGDTIDPDLYPFTVQAIEALKSELKGIMTPREITQRMTVAAGRAFKMNKSVISAGIIAARGGKK